MIHETYERNHYPHVYRLVNTVSYSMLDVGCGICSMHDGFTCPVIIGVEAHRPYLENRKDHSDSLIPVYADALELSRLFMPRTFDSVMFHDSPEHFFKGTALQLLSVAERLARKRVIVFTPRGFFRQHNHDHFQLQGESYQEHRSGWEPEEFQQLGYEVLVFKGFHDATNPSFIHSYGADHPPVDALLAWKDLV